MAGRPRDTQSLTPLQGRDTIPCASRADAARIGRRPWPRNTVRLCCRVATQPRRPAPQPRRVRRPRVLKLAWVINVQKGGTIPFIAALMWWYEDTSAAAWVYLGPSRRLRSELACQGSRRPGPRLAAAGHLRRRPPLVPARAGALLGAAVALISPALGPGHPPPTPALMAACTVIFTVGLTLMLAPTRRRTPRSPHARPHHDRVLRPYAAPELPREMLIYGSFA